MSGRWAQGKYVIKNPAKYVGNRQPRYRSSWEWSFMRFCDNDPRILKWASESISIPYRDPFTGKQTIYVPDIFMFYQNKHGQQIAELIEIKPSAQTNLAEAKSMRDKAHVIINHAKWAAASAYCKRTGIKFRIVTESQLFWNGKK